MRIAVVTAALIGVSSAAIAAGADYYLKIEGVSRPAAAGAIYLKVTSSGDLDGDGVREEGIVRLNCAGGSLRAAHFHHNVKSPRDSASGLASGKRTHHPVTFVKEWGPSTPQFRHLKVSGWDIKKQEGIRRAASDGWQPLDLQDAGDVCPAADAAAKVKATKSRSNIQNN